MSDPAPTTATAAPNDAPNPTGMPAATVATAAADCQGTTTTPGTVPADVAREWHRACAEADLPAGRAKVVRLRDRVVALFHRPEGVRAIDDACPHRGASLADGHVVGGDVICPWHAWPFNLADGRSNGSDFWCVSAYPVRRSADGAAWEVGLPPLDPDAPAPERPPDPDFPT